MKKNLRILIVEDEAIIAKSLADTLGSMGYEVVGIADTGTKAIFEFFKSNPDLVLMDIRLKGPMDGIEAAENIRSQREIPIIFLTANQDPATFDRAKIQGAYGYVLKPFQERELQIVIEIAVNQIETQKRQSELEETLLGIEKLGAIGTLAAGIIHDVKNPLSLIYGGIDPLPKTGSPELEQARRFLEKGAQNIEALISTYRSLIDGTEVKASEDLNLSEVCREVFAVCRFSALRLGVTFAPIGSDPSVKVRFDKSSLMQVLVNLVRNACEAVEQTPGSFVRLEWEVENGHRVSLRIVDSGKGIPEELREKIFNPLFTTKAPGKGTGLGLSLCQRILAQSAGTLELDVKHANTCFVLGLPLSK